MKRSYVSETVDKIGEQVVVKVGFIPDVMQDCY